MRRRRQTRAQQRAAGTNNTALFDIVNTTTANGSLRARRDVARVVRAPLSWRAGCKPLAAAGAWFFARRSVRFRGAKYRPTAPPSPPHQVRRSQWRAVAMPLPNRVDPFGNLFADASRGLLFGNRGGRFHRDGQTLGARRWVSRRWICCRLDFKGRHRDVWGRGYTELFFLDEPTALAAGHRPCFECRRADARAFAAAFARGPAMSADEIDRVLHAERLDGRAKRGHRRALDGLPDGSVLTLADEPGSAWAVRGPALLRWTSGGYAAARARPRNLMVNVLTPPGTLAALAGGYRPRWHPSADARSL
jgi:hypothetical protein